MEDELLKRIDAAAGIVAESRAAFIREACRQRLKTMHAKELDRLYIEGHQSGPENLNWAESSAKLLSKRLPKEKWQIEAVWWVDMPAPAGRRPACS